MKALVTGGTGFIGSQVVSRLISQQHGITVFVRDKALPAWPKDGRIEVISGDLREPSSLLKAMEGIDVLFHLGEIRNTTRSASEKNVQLMEEIVRHRSAAGVKRIVFVSSITVSGIPSSFPADEKTPPRVILKDHYTAYKTKCEEILADQAGDGYAVIRPAPVYGPGSRYLGRLITAVERIGPVGIPMIGAGRNNAPLVFVKDLAAAICQAGIMPQAAGQVFNISDGIRHSWLEFLTAIAERLGKRLRIVPVPPLLLKVSAVPLELLTGFFGVELDALNYLDYFSRDLFFDNSRAKGLLQWQPEYGLGSGVSEMVDYYRSSRQG